MSHDAPAVRYEVKRWRLEKFDGDPPAPGEHKTPIEVIEGGDGLPTVTSYPAARLAAGLSIV